MIRIQKEDIRQMLQDRRIFRNLPEGLEDDTQIVFDSLSMLWLMHCLETEWGINLYAEDYDWLGVCSINDIHRVILGQSG
ncbi:hypothetical protein DFP94_10963 [Fontibacillus phaseoli]|uniref:Acyl carrier protein n=1 Tax=Fontibacillus phaseoli TaxID=1416533 RepID=A0A369B743_9BACL|nr:hypothetical protein [Fontibacillus phaseoli]RCX17339.1 hypothetical protein DFP94_10963 [Fontibacillus phaseoli]